MGVRVWPFEGIPASGPCQVFTELYLSLWPVGDFGGPCKDADQVQAMTQRWLDDQPQLLTWMNQRYPAVVYEEEGWVLGVDPASPAGESNAGLSKSGARRTEPQRFQLLERRRRR